MRKQAQKRVSSVTLFSPIGIRDQRQLQPLSSLPNEKRNENEFNQDLTTWLNDEFKKMQWLMELPSPEMDVWLRDKEMSTQEAQKHFFQKAEEFNALVHDSQQKALIWRKELTEKVTVELRGLYLRYGIMPAPVLDMLAGFKAADRMFDQKTWIKLRNRNAREKDANVLDKAAKIVEQYEPFLPPRRMEGPNDRDGIYPSRTALEQTAHEIRDLFPSQRHRPKELELILFARELAKHFLNCTRHPLYEYVGNLLLAALPEKWNPAGKVREAAKKLVKAGNGAEEDLRYMAELLVDVGNAIRMSDQYWGRKRKQKVKGLKASKASRPREAKGG